MDARSYTTERDNQTKLASALAGYNIKIALFLDLNPRNKLAAELGESLLKQLKTLDGIIYDPVFLSTNLEARQQSTIANRTTIAVAKQAIDGAFATINQYNQNHKGLFSQRPYKKLEKILQTMLQDKIIADGFVTNANMMEMVRLAQVGVRVKRLT